MAWNFTPVRADDLGRIERLVAVAGDEQDGRNVSRSSERRCGWALRGSCNSKLPKNYYGWLPSHGSLDSIFAEGDNAFSVLRG